eukprot:TRINITY_DN13161_c1_g1_i1.p1 TRINITY_DN13161_c1_g1~~TRINITY_DN13161_c1_g1_i1.p1  ORF type:complete len:602 (+),score=111.84 TRINITY_DN13161_c1_g1_i1:53-1858(+)
MGNTISTLQDPTKAIAAVVGIYVLLIAFRKSKQSTRRKELQARATQKRKERDEKRKTEFADLDFAKCPDNLKIINMTASQMLDAMNKGELTSEQIVTAICARAKQAGEELDVCAEENYTNAIKEARLCDEERKAGKLRGILHGLPISIKDQIHQKGFDSTCGLACRVGQPLTYTSCLVQLLVNEGAITYVRSNIPQALMLPESFNAIWGVAKNPYDKTRTPGGSSGGEGALVATGASALGIGTDIGGSIRIPAAFCGVFGFKPTPQRISGHGCGVPRPGDSTGQIGIPSVAGPLARSVEDLELVMKIWCGTTDSSPSMHDFDSTVPRSPWIPNAKKIKFGYFISDEFFPPSPCYYRAMEETVRAVKAAGYEVVPIKFDLSKEPYSYIKLSAAEGHMQGFIDGLEGEALHEYYNFLYKLANLPSTLRSAAVSVQKLLGKERMASLIDSGRKLDTYQYWAAVNARNRQKQAFINYMNENEITAILSPGMGMSAFKHGSSTRLNMACSYTFLWNLFQFPAGTIPVTHVKEGEDTYPRVFKDTLEASAYPDIKGSVGLPVCVQVTTLPFKDELCISAMKVVETAVSDMWKKPEFKAFTSQLKANL